MKKTVSIILIFLAASCSIAFAQDEPDYNVKNIKSELLKDAHAVKRFETIRFEIKDPGSAILYTKRAITILDEAGSEYASLSESYDKRNNIRSVDAILYDANGNKIKSLKNKDIVDVGGIGTSLADDIRYKFHSFNWKAYPYTVVYELEVKQSQLMFMPNWVPADEGMSVESSVLEVTAPADYKIRYKSFQYSESPAIVNSDNRTTYRWELKDYAAKKRDEFAAPQWNKVVPSVFLAPTEFEIEGYKGNMSDWKEFGKFMYALKAERDKLPDNIKAKVHELADPITDEKQKIAVLYKYLQDNTRYISIQLGIGGWQPLDASFVSTKNYGDCKALTNYMYALLKEAGIRSVYTIIKASQNKPFFMDDFPSSQFNHVILAVPIPKDTVWLECTSQTLQAGYLSAFTADRSALMITEDGGKLVRTPAYRMKDNIQSSKVIATLDASGKLDADIVTRYSCLLQDKLYDLIKTHTQKEQMEWLRKNIDLPDYDITSFDYKTIAAKMPVVKETIRLTSANYAQITGKRLFIQPNVFNRSSVELKEDEERKLDIHLQNEYAIEDSTEINLPSGYTVERIPQTVSLSGKFGTYRIAFSVTGNKITMSRLLQRKSGNFPKSDYTEMASFYNEVFSADRARIVLVKKE